MDFKVLAIGDITGERGVDHLRRHLRALKKEKSVDFVVANGENAAGNGLLPTHAEEIFAAGADVITLGNHSYGKTQIAGFLEESPYILRPANFTGRAPGRGWAVYDLRPGAGGCAEPHWPLRPGFQCGKSLYHRRPSIEKRGQAHLHSGGFPRPGHQREAGPVVLFGRPGQRPVGDPHPRTHRRWASLPQGHGLSHRPGYDRADGVCAGRSAGAIGGVFPGGAAGPISDGRTAPAGCREPCLHWIAAPACAPGWSV